MDARRDVLTVAAFTGASLGIGSARWGRGAPGRRSMPALGRHQFIGSARRGRGGDASVCGRPTEACAVEQRVLLTNAKHPCVNGGAIATFD